jgi:hypothetical protein
VPQECSLFGLGGGHRNVKKIDSSYLDSVTMSAFLYYFFYSKSVFAESTRYHRVYTISRTALKRCCNSIINNSSNTMTEDSSSDEESLYQLKSPRTFISLHRKIEICNKWTVAKREKTNTLKGIAREEGVAPFQIRTWMKKLLVLKQRPSLRSVG